MNPSEQVAMEIRWPDGEPEVLAIGAMAEHLKAGRSLCLATESFVGLIGLAHLDAPVAAILAAKGSRELSKGMPLLAAGTNQVAEFCALSPWARDLASQFWPGPLTLALPPRWPEAHSSGGAPWPMGVAAADGTIGVRVPNHEGLLALVRAAGSLLTATSANVSGKAAVCDVQKVSLASWQGIVPCRWPQAFASAQSTEPSTVIGLNSQGVPQILRAGRIAGGALAPFLGAHGIELSLAEVEGGRA